MFPKLIVGSTAEISKLLEPDRGLVTSVDHVGHVWGEYKRSSVSLDGTKHLCISQDLSKVNVKHVSRPLNHDVVIVTITYSQHVGCHTVAGTRVSEVLCCLEEKERRERERERERERKVKKVKKGTKKILL